ncbi:1379_t:CDS:2 [Rhizophagus irregularis]|nr:1379_t:CDS:2 [Rhizophagus irregularis]
MSGRNRIPQSTSQRLNKNRFSKNRNASKNRFKKNRFEELKQDVSDLINLARENNYILLQSKVDKLERENKRLRYDNDELSKFLQDDDESTDDDSNSEDEDDDSDSEDENESDDDSDSEDEDESDVSFRPAKRQMRNKLSDEERAKVGSYSESDRSNQSTIIRKKKPKGSKANNIFEDEIENKAKSIMKALLNTYPYELTLRIEDTFRSQINKDICERLIPKLQEDVRPAYNLSYDQVETWLQTFHRYKRNTYLRSHFMMIDDD